MDKSVKERYFRESPVRDTFYRVIFLVLNYFLAT